VALERPPHPRILHSILRCAAVEPSRSTWILKQAYPRFSEASRETDIGPNETLYGAIRCDDEQVPIEQVVRCTYIPDLHLIPGNLELMEFEHDTPRALMTRKEGDTLFDQAT